MQFIDLKAQYQKIKSDVDQRIMKVLSHQCHVLGPEVFELEDRLAKYVGVPYCITVSNGSDALLLAMMALGIGPSDEVITTSFTFAATVGSIELLGAKPVLIDIDPKTYNMDPALIEAAITPRTKALLPVNLYGQCPDYQKINEIAKKHNLFIIEDAAQSFGAEQNGQKSCTFGTIACTSFFPSKPLGCYGEGGACFTKDAKLAERLQQLRVHGQSARYKHDFIGINGRMETLQAAILLSKLEIFDEELSQRQYLAEFYNKKITTNVFKPLIEKGNTHVFAQYTIASSHRNTIQAHLTEKKIPYAIHYPIPLHLQPAFTHLNTGKSFHHAEIAADQVLSLPFHPYLSEDNIEFIANTVNTAVVASQLEYAESEEAY